MPTCKVELKTQGEHMTSAVRRVEFRFLGKFKIVPQGQFADYDWWAEVHSCNSCGALVISGDSMEDHALFHSNNILTPFTVDVCLHDHE